MHCLTLHYAMPRHASYSYNCKRAISLYARLDYITFLYVTQHYTHDNLHYTTSTTPLHYSYSCATPRYIRQLWVRTSPLGVLFLTFPPPPCAVLVRYLCGTCAVVLLEFVLVRSSLDVSLLYNGCPRFCCFFLSWFLFAFFLGSLLSPSSASYRCLCWPKHLHPWQSGPHQDST